MRADRPASPPRCSSVSLGLDEPLHGTASTVRSWVLVEQPGAWGYDAPLQCGFPRRVMLTLLARTGLLGVRVILIRRHGTAGREAEADLPVAPEEEGSSGGSPRRCYLVHTGRERSWIEAGVVGDPREVLDLDFERLARGEPTGFGARDDRPLYLVCTNGKRDPCCAERGRPLAGALAPALGDRLWECSHIGGDRFAGNLVCFPAGVYYGRVGAADAIRVAMATEGGSLDLDHYRGRSAFDFAVQAAEWFLRTERGLRGIDEVRVTGSARHGDEVRATFAVADGTTHEVRVRIRPSTEPQALTCHSERPAHPPRYERIP